MKNYKNKSSEELKGDIETLEMRIDRLYKEAERDNVRLSVTQQSWIQDAEILIGDMKDELSSRIETPLSRSGQIFNSADGPFRSLGDQLLAIRESSRPGGRTDPRLFRVLNAATGLNETTPSEGGFLLQQDFGNQLLQGVFETGVLAPRCNRVQISGNANSIKLPAVDETSRASGSRWGGIRGYWKDEAALKTASKPKFRQMELNLKKIIGLCYATDELLADAGILETVIRQGFTDEINFMLDDAIINGTGAGMPLGILNSGCLVTQDAETGQDPDTVVTENLVKMYSRMPARNRKNGIWLINQAIEPQLFTMSLAVGAGGGPVYLPGGGLSEQPYATLFNRPVIAIEQCSDLGEVGDIIFADLNSYILAEKGGLQTDMSIHVQFVYDESVFRFVLRVDGSAALASPITPYSGGDDLSPFVTLAAR